MRGFVGFLTLAIAAIVGHFAFPVVVVADEMMAPAIRSGDWSVMFALGSEPVPGRVAPSATIGSWARPAEGAPLIPTEQEAVVGPGAGAVRAALREGVPLRRRARDVRVTDVASAESCGKGERRHRDCSARLFRSGSGVALGSRDKAVDEVRDAPGLSLRASRNFGELVD